MGKKKMKPKKRNNGWKLPKFDKRNNTQIQDVQNPEQDKPKKSMSRYIINKLLRNKDKDLDSSQRKTIIGIISPWNVWLHLPVKPSRPGVYLKIEGDRLKMYIVNPA